MELTGNVQGLIDLVGGGSDVEYEQILESGEKIGVITIDDVPTDIYAPEGSDVEVTQVVSSGTKIATITVDDTPTDIYAPEAGSNVDVTQVVSSGTKIATITVDDTPTDIYAPEAGSDVEVTQVVSSGTKIATITVDDTPTDIYAPAGGGSYSITALTNDLSATGGDIALSDSVANYDLIYIEATRSGNNVQRGCLIVPTALLMINVNYSHYSVPCASGGAALGWVQVQFKNNTTASIVSTSNGQLRKIAGIKFS